MKIFSKVILAILLGGILPAFGGSNSALAHGCNVTANTGSGVNGWAYTICSPGGSWKTRLICANLSGATQTKYGPLVTSGWSYVTCSSGYKFQSATYSHTH